MEEGCRCRRFLEQEREGGVLVIVLHYIHAYILEKRIFLAMKRWKSKHARQAWGCSSRLHIVQENTLIFSSMRYKFQGNIAWGRCSLACLKFMSCSRGQGMEDFHKAQENF